jgi:predicted HAD superfamily phosphohydrolase YqeG
MSTDHVATIRHSLRRWLSLLGNLRPTFQVASVAEIDGAFLERHGIRAVLWDVDGTLMSYHGDDVDPAFPHLRTLLGDGSTRHAILSNCDEGRFEELGKIFSEIPVIRAYTSPTGPVFRHKLRGGDTHSANEVDAVLRSGRQIRKPSGELVRYGMRVLDVHDPAAVLMIGDQYLTDVASANLAGTLSAKVRTHRRDTFPTSLRLGQNLERLVYAVVSVFS